MKRFLAIAMLSVLLLSGCQKQEEVKNLPDDRDFNCNFTAQLKDFNLSGSLSLPTAADPVITITSPSELQGMELTFSDETVTVKHLGILIELPVSQYPQLAVGNVIFSVLKDAASAVDLKVEKTESGYTFSGRTELGRYKLQVDDTLAPIQITIDAAQFTCQFS